MLTLAEAPIIKHYQGQGFSRVVIRDDEPNFSYPIHFHNYTLALQVIEGSLTIVMNNTPTTVEAGDHVMIPANAMHSVVIGPAGCRYIHAEK
jgi:quercetin dioxygenase-like cupin family protein